MTNKRHKLRLRKQVIICIPVVILLIICTTVFIINKHNTFSNTINTNESLASEKKAVTEETLDNSDNMKLTDISYIKNFDKLIATRQKDNTVIFYAQSFKLNIDKTLDIAHKLTNNYEDANYLKTNVIAPSALAKKLGSFNSFEAGVVYFVRDLYRYPEKYGSSISEIRLSETPTPNSKSSDGKIYMSNGLTFEQYLGKICDLYGIDKSITLAIVHEESGIMTSGLFTKSNNIGGLKGYDGWMSFPTLEAGVIAHVLSIKSIVDKYGIDMNSSNAVAALSGIYVKGNINSYSESWTTKVNSFRTKINQKDLFTIK